LQGEEAAAVTGATQRKGPEGIGLEKDEEEDTEEVYFQDRTIGRRRKV